MGIPIGCEYTAKYPLTAEQLASNEEALLPAVKTKDFRFSSYNTLNFQDIGIVSNDLMYVELLIRKQNECRELLVNVTRIYPGMYCAGFLEGGKDSCQVTHSSFFPFAYTENKDILVWRTCLLETYQPSNKIT